MSPSARQQLADQAKEMFYHGYNSYMHHAFPADELMPLTCSGRVRGVTPSRGDVDDSLGHYSLTLVDSLDTLVVLGNITAFVDGVQLVLAQVSFDTDIVVSTFEANIRVLGGLLGAHAVMLDLRRRVSGAGSNPAGRKLGPLPLVVAEYIRGYTDELVVMAHDLGERLLQAFDTPTGLPFSRINLRHGVTYRVLRAGDATCTACAGTMVMEFGALSRYSGDPRFENAARKALQAIWSRRGRSSNLVGTTINITDGRWLRRDSGVGAGSDSYYEYLFKAYVMLGDRTYLNVFNKHYEAIIQYLKRGPYLVDADMNNPSTLARKHMDALQTFFPGLQVLKGDLAAAIETHGMYFNIMERHKFIPESFTQDGRVNWAQHPLRPEFAESTYFLYRATGNPFYLEVGKVIMAGLQDHTRVPCGFAAVKDVRKMQLEDQMDSFVLAETFKYLYLLFADDADIPIDMEDYIFTTEAHLLPLSLANVELELDPFRKEEEHSFAFHDHSCRRERAQDLANFYKLVRVHTSRDVCLVYNVNIRVAGGPRHKAGRRGSSSRAALVEIEPEELDLTNPSHIAYINHIGISVEHDVATGPAAGVRLVHQAEAGNTAHQKGFHFMQRLIHLSHQHEQERASGQEEDRSPVALTLHAPPSLEGQVFVGSPAAFGPALEHTQLAFTAALQTASPLLGCETLRNRATVAGKILLVKRGRCMFVDKVRHAEAAGAMAVIVIDNAPPQGDAAALFTMSGDQGPDVGIPSMFLRQDVGERLLDIVTVAKDATTWPVGTAGVRGRGEMMRLDGAAARFFHPLAPFASNSACVALLGRMHAHDGDL